jgi:phosphatidylethanolamine/phosphatidyl-N-methylethanolamine N-methyltransferase
MGWSAWRWSLYAPFYDPILRALRGPRGRAVALLDPQPGERLLIVGCGTGLDLEFLPRDAQVIGIDLSPAMVRRANARAKRLGFAHASFEVMDAQRMNFPDSTFDGVLLHLILAVAPDGAAVACEAARVLRPGGRASILDKFSAADGETSLLRRLANPVFRAAATEINRDLATLLSQSGLQLVHREPAALNGFFQIALAKKPA